MSLNQSGAQSNKPLGGGEKTEASLTNRILYGLLAVLIVVFVWKMVSVDNSDTMDIPEEKKTSPHSADDDIEKVPNIDVEIEEMETPVEQTSTVDAVVEETIEEISSSPRTETNTISAVPTTTYESTSNSYTNSSLQRPNHLVSQIKDSYSYIYTGEVEMPNGTFRGLDANGFAITKPTLEVAVAVSRFDGKTGGLVQIPEEQLYTSYQPKPVDQTPVFTKRVESITKDIIATRRTEEYPSTGVSYEDNAYPLDDTLAWHPYESLKYIKEEKEVFVAEKVRAMPTSDELEPFIHPSTLGDRDTRMGYGVVIRPSK